MRKLLLAGALLLGLGTLSGCHLASAEVRYSDHGPKYSGSAYFYQGSGNARYPRAAYYAPPYRPEYRSHYYGRHGCR